MYYLNKLFLIIKNVMYLIHNYFYPKKINFDMNKTETINYIRNNKPRKLNIDENFQENLERVEVNVESNDLISINLEIYHYLSKVLPDAPKGMKNNKVFKYSNKEYLKRTKRLEIIKRINKVKYNLGIIFFIFYFGKRNRNII